MGICDLVKNVGPIEPRREFVTGPMFSGKTTAVNAFIEKHAVRPQRPYLIFKLNIDYRFGDENGKPKEVRTVTHDKEELHSNGIKVGYPSVLVGTTEQAYNHIEQFVKEHQDVAAVAFEEAQLWDEDILSLFNHLANHGVHVIATGLNLDYRRDPFFLRKSGTLFRDYKDEKYGKVYDYEASSTNVLEFANYAKHIQIYADCLEVKEDGKPCSKQAPLTQRWWKDRPSHYIEPLIAIGGKNASGVHDFIYGARCVEHHIVVDKPLSDFQKKLYVVNHGLVHVASK